MINSINFFKCIQEMNFALSCQQLLKQVKKMAIYAMQDVVTKLEKARLVIPTFRPFEMDCILAFTEYIVRLFLVYCAILIMFFRLLIQLSFFKLITVQFTGCN
ncbi:hypothetical protein V8G54_028107 [Vigna mungo]|uniref:Uncharacterized protein n=1 Tax=Vigna mungo TaxID=3915 RepID=A0AAQ3MRS9_VIGMU